MPTILHLSDLHRSAGPRLANSDLLPAILSDTERWNAEGIPAPDLIVVSGDLIQGVGLNECNPDESIDLQYQEVEDFLERLTTELVGSDRSRIVIVPGNHDVHWNRSVDAMVPLNPTPDGFAQRCLDADSGLRWSWRDLQAYRVANHQLYRSRLEHFREFQRRFYEGVTAHPIVEGVDDLLFFEYPELDLLIAGFASWHGNDCFCNVGAIGSTALARSQELLSRSKMRIPVAVWHHGITGEPRSQDYMDQRIVHRLIDFGFRIGLHGHQHFPGMYPVEIRLPNSTSMIVVGAGSLAVGDSELPMGERRQYNVIVIDPNNESITTHVRGMTSAGIFTAAHRDEFGGKSSIELELTLDRNRVGRLGHHVLIDEAITAIGKGKFEDALAIVSRLPIESSVKRREIEIEALRGLGKVDELIRTLNPPKTVTEVAELIHLLLDQRKYDEAQNLLINAESFVPNAIQRDLQEQILVRRMIA